MRAEQAATAVASKIRESFIARFTKYSLRYLACFTLWIKIQRLSSTA
jgi:hypothetical protein